MLLEQVEGNCRFCLAGRAHEGFRRKRHEVAVAGLILCEDNEARQLGMDFFATRGCIIMRQRKIQPHNGLDAVTCGFLGKFQSAEQVRCIGQRQRRLLVFLSEGDEFRNWHRPFQQGIGRMHPQMNEARTGHRISRRRQTSRLHAIDHLIAHGGLWIYARRLHQAPTTATKRPTETKAMACST